MHARPRHSRAARTGRLQARATVSIPPRAEGAVVSLLGRSRRRLPRPEAHRAGRVVDGVASQRLQDPRHRTSTPAWSRCTGDPGQCVIGNSVQHDTVVVDVHSRTRHGPRKFYTTGSRERSGVSLRPSLAVAGVSRSGSQPANAIFRKLRDCSFDVVPVNSLADQLEGATCYPDLASIPGVVDGLMVVTPPAAAASLVRQAGARRIRQIWFHRSFGEGSVCAAALQTCAEFGIRPIVGGCPLTYCEPIDLAHRCFRWWLSREGRVPV